MLSLRRFDLLLEHVQHEGLEAALRGGEAVPQRHEKPRKSVVATPSGDAPRR